LWKISWRIYEKVICKGILGRFVSDRDMWLLFVMSGDLINQHMLTEHLTVPSEYAHICWFFEKTCSKKGHETQFLSNFCMNWQQKYFLVCRESFLTQKCVANEKSLEDTDL